MEEFDFWYFAAGLALFIYGMFRVEDSLKNLAGRSFKKFLQHHTRQPFKAVLAGTGVTAILQSSSVVLLMILSFVGAGILELRNALAIVLGSNLGTTISSWVVAVLGFTVDIARLTYPLLAIALSGLIFFRFRPAIKNFSEFLVGFSLLFIGLEWMKSSAGTLSDPTLLAGITQLSPYLMIPVGFLFTVIVQSSSATMVVVLTAINHELIPLSHGAAMVIGSELGTGIKLLVGSIGGIADKKRVALGNFYINVITLILSAILLYPLLNLISGIIGESHALLILVAFQSSMNLLSIMIFLPFLKQFADFLLERFKKDEDEEITAFIHRTPDYPDQNPVELAGMEVVLLLRKAYQLNRQALEIREEKKSGEEGSWFNTFKKLGNRVYTYEEQYRRIKLHQGEILDFIHETQQENLSANQVARMNTLVSVCREAIHAVKNIKDIRHNIIELSDTAEDQLYVLFTDLQARERSFYTRLEALLDKIPMSPPDKGSFQDFLRMNKEEHEHKTSELFNMLKSDKISELRVSTMLNVYREIYSSHKALIMATADLLEIEGDWK